MALRFRCDPKNVHPSASTRARLESEDPAATADLIVKTQRWADPGFDHAGRGTRSTVPG